MTSFILDFHNSYWDIDCGFVAMSMLGNYFSEQHAEYIMKRVIEDPSWRAMPALSAMIDLSARIIESSAIQNFLLVASAFMDIRTKDFREQFSQAYEKFQEKIDVNAIRKNIFLLLDKCVKRRLEALSYYVSDYSRFANEESRFNEQASNILQLLKYIKIDIVTDPATRTIRLDSSKYTLTFDDDADYGQFVTFMTNKDQPPNNLFGFCKQSAVLKDAAIMTMIQNKRIVVGVVSTLLQKGIPSEQMAARLLAATQEKTLNDYWDIDGGFEAMAQLGDRFTERHAEYFIERVIKDSSWRAKPALEAMKILSTKTLEEDVLKWLLLITAVAGDQLVSDETRDYFNTVQILKVNIGEDTIKQRCCSLLQEYMNRRRALAKKFITDHNEFNLHANSLSERLRCVLKLLKLLEIEIEFDLASKTVYLYKCRFHIVFDNALDFDDVQKLYIKSDSPSVFIQSNFGADRFLSQATEENLIALMQNKSYVVDVVSRALASGKFTESQLAERLLTVVCTPTLNWYWDVNGGIEAISLLGNGFNMELAKYFVNRVNIDASYRCGCVATALITLKKTATEQTALESIVYVVNQIRADLQRYYIGFNFEEFFPLVKEDLPSHLRALAISGLFATQDIPDRHEEPLVAAGAPGLDA